MTELLTAAQMRAVETAAIESGSVTGLELMERAGQGVVNAVLTEWPQLAAGSFCAVVLCGPGNNGGDGFVVARLLKNAGWDVDVFLYGDAEKLPPDARANYVRWSEMGEVAPLNGVESLTHTEPDLVLDALFGTGLTRPITGLEAAFLDVNEVVHRARFLKKPMCRITAVDLPSGLCSDSGKVLTSDDQAEEAIWQRPTGLTAQLTVTFHAMKLGHILADGPDRCGKTVVADIGLKTFIWPEKTPAGSSDMAAVNAAQAAPMALAKQGGHKYTHGHALVLSGGPAHSGAARLAARGALRIGAGVVTLGVPPNAQMEVAGQVTAVMVKRVADGAALAEILGDERINALCLGPALGLTDAKTALIEAALASKRALVLDADALSLIAKSPDLFAALHPNCVLTPHAGEFARLFPDLAEKLNAPATQGPAYSKVDAARAAAERANCTVLLKGADTVIASPDGRCAVNASAYERAAPWLATAGAGDVLAGFITGLLARGFAPQQAAEAGAYLHTQCAMRFGAGLIAEDLPDELPKVFRSLGV